MTDHRPPTPSHVCIRGRRWRLRRPRLRKDDGYCEMREKEIAVDASLSGERELDVLLHEMLHAAVWDLSEEAVTETATDIARALWRLGYRRDRHAP